MSFNIKTAAGRAKLPPRREQYWERIGPGQYVGVRPSTVAGRPGNWSARFYDDATGKKPIKALGTFEDVADGLRFDAASKAASEWFTHLQRGGAATKDVKTVDDACTEYLKHVLAESGADAEQDARGRLKRLVTSKPIGALPLAKLTLGHVQKWRQGLTFGRGGAPRAKSTINRDTTALRAVLNYALAQRWVTSPHAWEAALKPHRGVAGRRECYLTKEQRDTLLSKVPTDLQPLLQCLCALPLRPGAAAALRVKDFDPARGVLSVTRDKAGAGRKLPLPPSAALFLTTHTEGKAADAPIFQRADGKAWDRHTWKKLVRPAVAAAELPPEATAYSLRHSAITDLLTKGGDPLTVARLAGTSLAMIQAHYGHLVDEQSRAALALLGA